MTAPSIPQLLDFEAGWFRHTGHKEMAIQAQLDIAPGRYYQLLGRAIDSLEGQAHNPQLCRALRTRRDQRTADRPRITT